MAGGGDEASDLSEFKDDEEEKEFLDQYCVFFKTAELKPSGQHVSGSPWRSHSTDNSL